MAPRRSDRSRQRGVEAIIPSPGFSKVQVRARHPSVRPHRRPKSLEGPSGSFTGQDLTRTKTEVYLRPPNPTHPGTRDDEGPPTRQAPTCPTDTKNLRTIKQKRREVRQYFDRYHQTFIYTQYLLINDTHLIISSLIYSLTTSRTGQSPSGCFRTRGRSRTDGRSHDPAVRVSPPWVGD